MKTEAKYTFAYLAKLEPELRCLLQEAREYRGEAGNKFCANAAWYGEGGLKDELCQLVGWERHDKHPVLSSRHAYDVAYETIYNALPECIGCGPICI